MPFSPFSFWSWLMENEEYEPYRGKVDQAAASRQFAFASWFPPNGRVYLPFVAPTDNAQGEQGYDKEIADVLRDAGYAIKDYRAGLAVDGRGRVLKIGKVLAAQYQKETTELNAQRPSFSDLTWQKRWKMHEDSWKEIMSLFQNSAHRVDAAKTGGSGYTVVITSDVHDIGQMSTGRDWISCMNLKNGAHSSDVYKEVKNGGFVAYLVRNGDENVRKPLARMAIHRYDNKSGQSIAVPEDTVYGNGLEGFYEVVKKWIDSKQGPTKVGVYKRRGGQYSDTYPEGMVFGTGAKASQVVKMLEFGVSKGPWDRRRRPYIDVAMAAILSPSARFGSKALNKFAEMIADPKYDITGIAKADFCLKYPNSVTQALYDQLPSYMKDRFDRVSDRFVAGRTANVDSTLDNDLSISNPSLGIVPGKPLEYSTLSRVDAILQRLHVFKPMPERVVQKVVRFGNDLVSRYPVDSDDRCAGIIREILHLFSMTGADTPSVLGFYRELLPYWDKVGGLDTFGYAMSKLGLNGSTFLPFLRSRLEGLSKGRGEGRPGAYYRDDMPKIEERFRYVIDSIENGTGRSDKYTFFF